MDARKIGAFISDLRKNKLYTQAELAQLLNVSHQAVSKWERGESLPDIGLLPLVAKQLDVTIDELLHGERNLVSAAPAPAAECREDERAITMSADPSVEAGQRLTFDHLSGLAPFLSKEALDSMIEREREMCDGRMQVRWRHFSGGLLWRSSWSKRLTDRSNWTKLRASLRFSAMRR